MCRHTETVYLIHFARPYKHARHYLGSALNLEARLAHHRTGTGARLLAVVNEADIAWCVVRTWPGDKTVERKLKDRHNAKKLCPVCRAEIERLKGQTK